LPFSSSLSIKLIIDDLGLLKQIKLYMYFFYNSFLLGINFIVYRHINITLITLYCIINIYVITPYKTFLKAGDNLHK